MPRRGLTPLILVALLVAVLGLGAGDFPSFAAPQATPATVELAQGWKLASAHDVPAAGAEVSQGGYDDAGWHAVRRMPSTVLQTLQDDGMYPDLYSAPICATTCRRISIDRTGGTAPRSPPRPVTPTTCWSFPGINYRAEIWLNGHLLAGNNRIVGMYTAHDLDVTPWIRVGQPNTLAVKVTPEQALQDINGVELADSWWDWINWRDIGYQGPGKPDRGTSFVPDRNAGIWKPV